jgi:perosamine synthetase
MEKRIKLFDPIIGTKEEKAIKKVLKSKFWASGSGVGEVEKFENKMKKFLKADECVAVNSGTAALHLALSLIDVKNKEVIIPSLSFVSTANSVLYNHGIPVFVDVDETSLNLDPNDLKKKISNKTKAIIPVHFAGLPANMNEITNIAKKNNLSVIEDAAHACGSNIGKKKIGTHSPFGCFSFHPVKNLAMPSGGLISINSTNAKKFKKKLNTLRWCGITNRKNSIYDVTDLGWNCYMNEFSAAIGLIQLEKLNKLNIQRKKIAKKYSENILLKNKMPFDDGCSYHFYWIRVKNRTKFRNKLLSKGIETGIHYKPIHTFSFYKSKIDLPITEKVSEEIVSLPTHPNLTENELEKIIKNVNEFS